MNADLAAGILEGMEVGVAAVDEAGKLLLMNRAGARILGCEAQALEGRLFMEAFPQFRIGTPAQEAGVEVRRLDFKFELPGGRAVELGATYRSLRTPDDSLLGIYLFKDTSQERRQVQQEERHRQYAYLDELASAFAHEVRNPLASIQAISYLIRQEKALKSLPDYGDRLERLTVRVDNLVKDLLAFGRPSKAQPERLPVERIVGDCLEALKDRLGTLESRPALHLSEPGLEVLADPGHAARILAALIENALDAVGDPARVAIFVGTAQRPDEDRVVTFEVRDDGPGIPPGVLPKIFRPFFSTKPRGAGFGLAIAQRLAEDNLGHVEVRSEPGVQTAFTLSLPRA